jgi:hypothetical protein
MSLRQQVSLSHEVYATARAVHILTGESYSELIGQALAARLARDPALARRVEELQKALAA